MYPQPPADIDPGPHAAEFVWINSIISVSATVVLFYDYLLTLPREILFLWRPRNKQGWFTSACLLNRYIPVLGSIPVVVSYFIHVDFKFCEGLHIYREWFVMVVQTHAGALCMIRVHALYGRSRRILILLVTIGMASIINAFAEMFASRRSGGETIPVISSIPGSGCSQYTPAIGGQFAALAWTGVLVFDSVIFSLTMYKAFQIGRGVRLLDVMVRDGAMYFSALFIINLANMLTLRYSPPLLRTTTTTYTNVLSTTLVSRLILNLREQNATLVGLPTTLETERRFQAALPVARTTTSVGNLSVVRQNRSINETPIMVGTVGASC